MTVQVWLNLALRSDMVVVLLVAVVVVVLMKGWIDEKKMILRGGACRRSGVGECMRVRRPLCPLFISTGLGQFRGLRNEFQDVFTYILVVGGNERDQRPQLRVGRPWC